MTITDREIRAMDNKLKQLRVNLDNLGRLLDSEMTEPDRKDIENKMKTIWTEIQKLKKM